MRLCALEYLRREALEYPACTKSPFLLPFGAADIRNSYGSWVNNAQTVGPYASTGRSGPTCWAYPDMLMVGVGSGSCSGDSCANGVGLPTIVEQRSHFGLWCILSSPLTLSLDLTNATTTNLVWSIITNVDAIAINQAWAGAPGGVFASSASNITLQHCTPLWDGDQNCTLPVTQSWYKPLPNGDAAVFIANHGFDSPSVTVNFSDVPGLLCAATGTCDVFDIWAQAGVGEHTGFYSVLSLESHNSVFLRISAPSSPDIRVSQE